MIKGRCPTCSKPFAVAGMDDLPTFPFCSERCRLIDLGRWIDEDHAIPGPPVDVEPEDHDGPSRPPEANGRLDDED